MKRICQLTLAIVALVLLNPAQAAQASSPAAQASPAPVQAQAGKININTADKAELEELKGVGPKTADAIISWREAEGPFSSADQLLAIKGIGEKTLAGMRSQITVQ
ncbi:competence protein ComEA [Alcanivorax hongdengensis A-11-3]|uniref:Competence protein ComEA n=1 Tax=Alcanivorax hongdengensis A-11-3 TaxID=1177179 RepID=L0WC42_9GAMM|nr:helix-hairpin-helix domain-containing protein [Alcanivorax hongdengensis]EKF73305.1 competence protein ComEA [Alcanivorax hongdengensis A-11-3]